VVFAKLREPRPRAERLDPEAMSAPSPSSNWIWSLVLAGVLCVAGIGWLRVRQPPVLPAAVTAPPPVSLSPASVRGGGEPPPAALPSAKPPAMATLPPGQIAHADAALYQRLVDAVPSGRVTPSDVEAAVQLQARYPTEPNIQGLVTEMLMALAAQQTGARQYAEAVATLRRAVALPWADERVRNALLTTLFHSGDWPALEAYANVVLSGNRMNGEAWYALGYALFRQDRNREAADALRNGLQVREDARARELLMRIEKNAVDERGMTDRQLTHFHVRYDGDEHDDVGREVLRALERHYATLVIDLDLRPQNVIPVVLFSSEQYYDAAGAPAWAGGNYDGIDGRIRLPIGGITRNLTPDLDATLMHELTHAFIAEKSGGIAPRVIHEGLAQYMEGRRCDTRVSEALAKGRIAGVQGFYLQALSFVEYLVSVRGQGGINDLLKAMAETGNVDAAFQRVHGTSEGDMEAAWRRRLEQKYGG
jgi:tetratricopeptide (TPR) repeat protein